MPDYLCLLYNEDDGDEAVRAQRWAELPRWLALTERMREAGVWVDNHPLYGVEAATTVRVRAAETQITDGPFATTKEVLAGYYLLRCGDLDEALRWAAQLPIAEYGSVEVRPVMDVAG